MKEQRKRILKRLDKLTVQKLKHLTANRPISAAMVDRSIIALEGWL